MILGGLETTQYALEEQAALQGELFAIPVVLQFAFGVVAAGIAAERRGSRDGEAPDFETPPA